MDRTAVSGTAGTGSIPVGGASITYPYSTFGPRFEAPTEVTWNRDMIFCGKMNKETCHGINL